MAALALPGVARASDFEVTSDSSAQFYDVRSPTGGTVLTRRRFVTTLGASAYNLLDAPEGDPRAPELLFRARLRYDADYGADGSTEDPTNYAAVVPGFTGAGASPTFGQSPFNLMYAYLEGRRFLGGKGGFKLGRQYVTDVLGWWSFDGGEVSVTTPFFVKAEAYGGLEQRGGMPLSTSRFERDGVWRGNRSDFDPSLYPAFQEATAAPAFGVAVESTGVTWIHGRLTYRRVYNTGGSNGSEFASGLYAPALYDGWRISSERLGYAVDATWSSVGSARAGVIYDLYRAGVTSLYGSLDAYLGTRATVALDYDYYVPSFDGDSIWNFFAGEPTNDVTLRGDLRLDDRLSVAASGNVRVYSVQTAAYDPGVGAAYSPSANYYAAATYFPTNGHPFDEGGTVSARWRTGETALALRGAGNFGDEGDRVGADLDGERVFDTRYVVRGRAGVWQWDDRLRPDRSTTSFAYVAGLGYRFAPRSEGSVEWEHDMNGLVGQRFRLMFLLSWAVTK